MYNNGNYYSAQPKQTNKVRKLASQVAYTAVMANVTNYMLQYEANQNVCIYMKNMTIQDGMLRRERVTVYTQHAREKYGSTQDAARWRHQVDTARCSHSVKLQTHLYSPQAVPPTNSDWGFVTWALLFRPHPTSVTDWALRIETRHRSVIGFSPFIWPPTGHTVSHNKNTLGTARLSGCVI